tara:strand:+ start:3507 stop:3785 length:279 start_codon:yes stop_codon:yes gene_type:complete
MNRITIKSIVNTISPIKENLLNSLISMEEINIITKIEAKEYNKCLLKKVKLLLIEKDKIIPIVIIDKIIKKFTLSISFHHLYIPSIIIFLYY